uniref:Ig-like domain-containing protein n=1 Tax=Neogobius melanostomus TaxID=47308 RepID=A0A8C6UDX4_9GOBI
VLSTFVTVEVQRGAEVTLRCSNSSSVLGHLSWFHMSDQPNISQICSMIHPEGNVTFYSPAGRDKYTMSSNNSTLFLTVKKVVSSDGGLYFCGEKMREKTVIFTGTFLKVQENVSYSTNFPILIMAGVISLLVLLVGGLLLKIHKLLKGAYIKKIQIYIFDIIYVIHFNPKVALRKLVWNSNKR